MKPDRAYRQEVVTAKREWQKQVTEEVYQPVPGEPMSQAQVIGALNESAKAGDTIIAAAGTPPADLLELWDASRGRACHLEFGNSCMGYELPASLGVRVAQPKGEIYVLIGDGTYLINPTELVTAMQENLKVTVVISVNHGFQSIRHLQLARVGRDFGNEFRRRDPKTSRLEGNDLPIDFKNNAESLGARGWYVTTPDELCRALREAHSEERSCVIVAETARDRQPPGSGIWWDVAAAEVTNDPVTRKLRAEYEDKRRRLQHFYY